MQIIHRQSFAAGAGHGGRGGQGSGQNSTGSAYGSLFESEDRGCHGGDWSGTTDTGGRGGGVVQLTVSHNMKVDGDIQANGENGRLGGAGGSGGTVRMHINNMQVGKL